MPSYQVTEASFVISAPKLSLCPPAFGPEIAFAGRSNVGKSSLLNFLTGKSQLARVSSTPGRTRLLNFFKVSFDDQKTLGIVDLPGYGYAKISQEERRSFGPMMEDFIFGRDSLRALALLVDLRRDPEGEEKQIIELAKSRGFGLVVLGTKADELPKAKRFPRQAAISKGLGLTQPLILTSAKESLGRDEAWRAILKLLFPPPPPTTTEEPAGS